MSGEPTDPVLQAIAALHDKITQLQLDLLDRLDQLEDTMKQNREVLMREMQRAMKA
jgi:hypothetical protein